MTWKTIENRFFLVLRRLRESGHGKLLDNAVPPCEIASIKAAVFGKLESHSVNFGLGIPEEKETVVARHWNPLVAEPISGAVRA